MKSIRLTNAEIDQLLVSYKAQKEQLSQQLSKVQKTLKKIKREKERRSS